MFLIEEELEAVFVKLLAAEGIPTEDYRVRVKKTLGCHYVQVVWDGFDGMSVTSRQQWIWDRLRGMLEPELRKHLGLVLLRSSKENSGDLDVPSDG